MKPDPVELVHVFIPVLVEAVVTVFAVGVAAMWVVILGAPA